MPEEEQDIKNALSEKLIFPDAATAFTYRPPKLQIVKDDLIVVLDTNVLLVPYTVSPKTLDEISLTFRKLVKEERLVIPAHVAREFAKNKFIKLGELYQQLTSKRESIKPIRTGKYPLLENIKEYKEIIALEKKTDDLIEKYNSSLSILLSKIKSWRMDDPVSLLYSNLFDASTVVEAAIDDQELLADMKRRTDFKIPPGYKDNSKETNAYGDLIIWHTILQIGRERKKSVLFVSGDMKPDWWHRSSGQALYPRYELVEEYRRHSEGNAVFLSTLSEFLTIFGADKRVVAEIREEEVANRTSAAYNWRFTSEFRVKSEKAVNEWLKINYPQAQITYNQNDSDVDFILTFPDGKRTAIDVIPLTSDNAAITAHHLVRRMNLTNRTVSQGIYFDIQMICVANNANVFPSLTNELRRYTISGCSQTIKLGALEDSQLIIKDSILIQGDF